MSATDALVQTGRNQTSRKKTDTAPGNNGGCEESTVALTEQLVRML